MEGGSSSSPNNHTISYDNSPSKHPMSYEYSPSKSHAIAYDYSQDHNNVTEIVASSSDDNQNDFKYDINDEKIEATETIFEKSDSDSDSLSDDINNKKRFTPKWPFKNRIKEGSRLQRWIDSFKPPESDLEGGEVKPKLKKTMKSRHVVMMSLGTGIGTGLLISNASCLSLSGPAPLVIGYGMVSMITYLLIQAAGELAVTYPTLPGNFNNYFSVFMSRPIGFATVWLATIQWITVVPLELIAATMTIKYWNTAISPDVFVVIFYVFLNFIHFFGVKAYGETEFIFNLCKVLMIIGFILMCICVNAGAGSKDGYIGGKYWHQPGAFVGQNGPSRFKDVCYILVTAFFSYGGTELFVLTINEQPNPRKTTPTAAKTTIYRILIVYMTTMILIGFTVPFDDKNLMGSNGDSSVHISPYVLAASIHGIKIAPHFINAVVLIALISVANSATYAAPRMMISLAEQKMAPSWLAYIDREGRPVWGLVLCALTGIIGFAASSDKEEQVFTWLAAIAGLATLFSWCGFFVSHIRFRQAMKLQGKNIKECGYLSPCGVWGSIFGAFFCGLVLIANFWVSLTPPGQGSNVSAKNFFENMLALPIWLFFVFGYMVYRKDWTIWNNMNEVDVDFHRKIYDPAELQREDEENKEALRNASFLKRFTAIWC